MKSTEIEEKVIGLFHAPSVILSNRLYNAYKQISVKYVFFNFLLHYGFMSGCPNSVLRKTKNKDIPISQSQYCAWWWPVAPFANIV